MARLIIFFCFSIFALLFLAQPTVAANLFNDGSEIEVQWYEKEGTILNEHVCFNYKDERRKYKKCRKQASQYFKEECAFFTDKVKNTKKKYKHMYEPEKKKFCEASENYTP